VFAEFAAARKHLIPELHTLALAQIEMSDRAEIALQELPARRQIKILEGIR
jgi:hypothetical protein